jgi:iron complex transport system substrate-binding protein
MLRTSVCLLVSLLIAACSRPAETPTAHGKGCIENFDPAKDYFPDKVETEFAENFSVEYHPSYKVVTVRRPSEGEPDEKYVLVQCGAPRPNLSGDLPKAPVIPVPIKSLFSASSTHMPLLVDLGHVEVLAGIGQARYVTTEPVPEWIRKGNVTEYAPNDVIDTELVILKAPSVLMSSGGGSAAHSEAYSTLRKAGIGIVANVEWQERSALGRAEWLKFMALFLNEEQKAREQFDKVRDRYMVLKARAGQIPEKERPRVMTGAVFRGMFDISGGASYVARLIADAGGTYVWADNKATGGTSVDMEAQIARASDADVWINGGDWTSLKAMLAEETRYRQFKPFQRGNVWLYNRILNESGGYDYWSRGITRPDLILGDLIKIFHPDLAKDHEFVWYKQVPRE